jgi:fatty-acyl-CoA synthase
MTRLAPRWFKERLEPDQRWDLKRKQGLPVTGVDIMLLNDKGESQPHDGVSVGEICVRGPWITAQYHDMPDSADRFTEGGYWRSGDAGTIDKDGYLKLTDRIKDVIKSGGEWISSIDMKNAIMSHRSVAETAVIGVPHPKWQERPVAIVSVKPGQELTADPRTSGTVICQMAVARGRDLHQERRTHQRRQGRQEKTARRVSGHLPEGLRQWVNVSSRAPPTVR